MALTATATSTFVLSFPRSFSTDMLQNSVQDDIITNLRMSPDHLFKAVHPFNRANLFYEVRYNSCPLPHTQMSDVFEFITTLYRRRERVSSGIVYCRTKKVCDELSGFLRARGVSSKAYHRGIR
jgi:superfamily II DNA helicase RecQ